jgi:hypothetical protein
MKRVFLLIVFVFMFLVTTTASDLSAGDIPNVSLRVTVQQKEEGSAGSAEKVLRLPVTPT